MQRWRGLDPMPGGWGRCVVTIGVFDGIHRGHQRLITLATTRASELQLPSVLVTFDPHPAEVVRPGSHPAQLTSLPRRAELVEAFGVDIFCVLPFTMEIANMSPETFVHELLVERLHVSLVVVGENFTFGHKATGDVALLRELGQRFGFAVEGAALVTDGGFRFSSTAIRAGIAAGDVREASEALGRPHRVEGIVTRGDGRGNDLGFPTANVSPPRYTAIPADGVYACYFVHRGRTLPAAVSVGTNPTFSGRERRVEAYVLDVSEDFYGEQVAVDFIERLRGMEQFDSIEALIGQMHDDVTATRRVLAGRI